MACNEKRYSETKKNVFTEYEPCCAFMYFKNYSRKLYMKYCFFRANNEYDTVYINNETTHTTTQQNTS
ncbi:MAG: hypothetical protein CMI56_00915 [Parcubacteria group bacterium]|nr:hypothetical protein [Parcubacteria group bacterium]|tara:strand:+ start:2529 stop:2732 length:204 start_codon:yes stop_codon:yes gene_type:complete